MRRGAYAAKVSPKAKGSEFYPEIKVEFAKAGVESAKNQTSSS